MHFNNKVDIFDVNICYLCMWTVQVSTLESIVYRHYYVDLFVAIHCRLARQLEQTQGRTHAKLAL